ncbi:MAG: hypothetical protein ABR589_12625 [Chthoniobacterales bacterium]
MKLDTHLSRLTVIALTAVSLALLPRVASGSDEYSFKVHNTTEDTITKLLASEDGKTYGFFDVGKGIKPGETVTLVWDKSTNDSSCEHYFKAVYEDGEESEPVKFDFCEEDLELEF